MAAGGDPELKEMLLEYIDNERGVIVLKKVLRIKSADIKHNLLMSVRGDSEWTGVFKAAHAGDVEMVRCMLAEFTPEQAYSVLQLRSKHDNTPLHSAANLGHVEVVKYLLSCVNQQQRFNLLMMKGYNGNTALHAALVDNKRDTAELILSTLSLQQQLQLVNIKDKYNKSVAELYSGFIAVELVAKGLPAVIDEQRRELAAQKEKMVKLTQGQAESKSTVDDQAAVIAGQKREIADQKREITRQKEQMVKLTAKQKEEMGDQTREAAELKQEIQRGKDKQTELERKLAAFEEKFDIFIRTPIVLGGEDDHEHVS